MPAAGPADSAHADAAAQPSARRPQPNAWCRWTELTGLATAVRGRGRGATELPNPDEARQTAGSDFRYAMHPAAVLARWPARRVASPIAVTGCHRSSLPGGVLPAEAAAEPLVCGIPIAEAGCRPIVGLAAAPIRRALALAPALTEAGEAPSATAPVRRNSGHPNSAGGHSVPSSVHRRPEALGPGNAAPSGPRKPARPRVLARWQW